MPDVIAGMRTRSKVWNTVVPTGSVGSAGSVSATSP